MKNAIRTRLAVRWVAGSTLALLVCIVLGACELPSEWTRFGEPRLIGIGDTFAIDEGTTVRLGKRGPMLSFVNVVEDSRCPADAACVRAGRAEAAFRLQEDDADTTFALTIPGLVETPYDRNRGIRILDLEFQLLELKPYPASTDSTRQSAYRALLTART